jgi:hypothetical protein
MSGVASLVGDEADVTYLLPFGDQHYLVPVENVLVYPRWANTRTIEEIDAVLRSSSAEVWKRCLTFGRMMRIRGVEGNALYTTFATDDQGFAHEKRMLRLVPWRVAHACFPEVREWAISDPHWGADPRHMAVYDWKKEVDLPGAPHLNPILNHWPTATNPRDVRLRAPSRPPSELEPSVALFWRRHAQPPPLVRRPPPLARPSLPMEDLRKLSDFLFECKDLVSEGVYLDASSALKRVWDSAI